MMVGIFKKLYRNTVNIFQKNINHAAKSNALKAWLKINGDQTLRLNYNLNENSLVFDIGGYQGQWTRDIFFKYNCNIYCFEPIRNFAEPIKRKFANNKKISVYTLGLSNVSKITKISCLDDSSSIFRGKKTETVQLIRAVDFFNDNGITKIDLMKINIEGGEYDLLEHLIKTDFLVNIVNIQVQFHDFMPNCSTRRKNIQNKISQTHKLTYCYEFVWENWERKF